MPGADVDAFAGQHLRHDRGGVRILPRQDPRARLDEGDLRAQPREGLGHLDTDRAAAEDDEASRQRGARAERVPHRVAGKIARFGKAGNIGNHRLAAGGDDDRARRQPLAVHLDRPRIDDPGVADPHVDAEPW